jgi:hypothetical protein
MSRLYELEKQLKEAKEELEKMGMSGCGSSSDMGGVVNGGTMSKKEEKKKKKMDPVGQEDEDIDNDGDVDSSDKYLKNRRAKISESMDKGEDCEDMVEEKIEEHEKEKHSAKGHKKEHNKIKSMAKSAREEMLIHLAKSELHREIDNESYQEYLEKSVRHSEEQELIKYRQNGQWTLEKALQFAGEHGGETAKGRHQRLSAESKREAKGKANFDRIIEEKPNLKLKSSDKDFSTFHARVGGDERRNRNLWNHQSED